MSIHIPTMSHVYVAAALLMASLPTFGQPPNVDPSCDALTGQARGICIAATSGVKCNTRERNENSQACTRLEETFRQETGLEPPWLPERSATGMDWIDISGNGVDYAIVMDGYFTTVDLTLEYYIDLKIYIEPGISAGYFDQTSHVISASNPQVEIDEPGVQYLLAKLDLETGELSWVWRRYGIQVDSSLLYIWGFHKVHSNNFDPRFSLTVTHRVNDER